jgi:hypothetical protein
MNAARSYLGRSPLRRFLVKISQDNMRASGSQRLRGFPANAPRTPCHDGDAAIKTRPIPDIHHFPCSPAEEA